MAQVAIRFTDKDLSSLPQPVRDAHKAFLARHKDVLVTAGAISHPETGAKGYAYQVDLPGFDPASLNTFLAEDPFEEAGAYTSTIKLGWRCALAYRHATAPKRQGLKGFFFHGIGKPNMTAKRETIVKAHMAHLMQVDDTHCLARGPLTNVRGETWEGSAMLYQFPTRDALWAFFKDEPYCVNGLYERIDLYDWTPADMA